jgi:hypothetical protein
MSTSSTKRHKVTYTSRPRDYRPHGHVVGHAPSDPPPKPLDDLPRGHVVGHANRG